jgi:MoxR-like ATPase
VRGRRLITASYSIFSQEKLRSLHHESQEYNYGFLIDNKLTKNYNKGKRWNVWENGRLGMKINEAKECIKELYLNTQCVTALISERGIGKTSAYKQCADELNIGYINLYAAALEGPDFMGLPVKDIEHGITVYLAPQFLPTKKAIEMGMYPPKGILVLEEINRVPSDTVSVLYPLLLEKKINGHDIADGWAIGVTMNPDTMNYLVNSLDDAMLDHFISIEVTAEIDDYISYSLKNNPNDEVLAYLNACPDMLLVVKKAADSTALSKYPTPRGWTKVQELLNNCTLDDKLMRELIAGVVGAQAAAAFYSFRKNKDIKIPSTRKLLENYEEIRADIQGLIYNRHIEIINYIIKKVITSFEACDKHFINLDQFLSDLPEELQILFFKHLSMNRPEEVETLMNKLETFDQISDKILDLVSVE